MKLRPHLLHLSILAATCCLWPYATIAADAMDTCHWQDGFHLQGLSGSGHALALYDDGSGAKMYAAGVFETAGEQRVGNIARWEDSAGWTPLGTGVDHEVFALAVYDDGSGAELYAGGKFRTAGGIASQGLARWDGSTWSNVDLPANAIVEALAVYNDGNGNALYAAATLEGLGWALLRWDGGTVTTIGTFSFGGALTLEVFDDGSGPALYVGGGFSDIEGPGGSMTHAPYLARWNGTSWSSLNANLNDRVSVLTVHDEGGGPELILAGFFATVGGISTSGIAKWDGTTWSSLPSFGEGISGDPPSSLLSFNDGDGPALYVSGWFRREVDGDIERRGVLRWRQGAWNWIESAAGTFISRGRDLIVHQHESEPALFVLGDIVPTDLSQQPISGIARWTGSDWTAPSRPAQGLSGTVRVLTELDFGAGPMLLAGGHSLFTWWTPLDAVVAWNGTAWRELGSGLGNEARALAVFDDGGGPELYAGGILYKDSPDLYYDGIFRWDGTQWVALADGVNDAVNTLEAFDDGSGPALYVGGWFTTAGGLSSPHVARWNGTSWQALGDGLEGTVWDFEIFDAGTGPALYAAWSSSFLQLGLAGLAQWDGTSWSAVPSPFAGQPNTTWRALAVHDDGTGAALYAAVQSTTNGPNGLEFTTLVVRWDGTGWESVGGLFAGFIYDLHIHDDGRGPALYASGNFNEVGGIPAAKLARWDSSAAIPAWTALNAGFEPGDGPFVLALGSQSGSLGKGLLVGGEFNQEAGIAASSVAKYTCDPLLFADNFEFGDLRRWISIIQ